ncbi:hypothetical protein FGG08_001502 [Glutinoglossum americanum]|uniref:Autophagy-related protein 14 n=1 Tax=Glutinoglossum americanum TaxID=1670608 RepID=A0A9P8L2P5_9PEZI|nr:hypothetical protein FGG08_001502 [Glutinoglossum americanum]
MAPSDNSHGTGAMAADPFTGPLVTKRDRPLLLPSNRKLRHLQGISLRNLSLSHPARRHRGSTNDDGILPHSWRSPAKLLAQQELHQLGHSRSSTDLNARNISAASKDTDQTTESPDSPTLVRLRRRSTHNWSGASPTTRQKKLEDVTSGRMADIWFSIHCSGLEGGLGKPVYVSEIAEKVMNPNFQFFDLNSCGPNVARLDETMVKFWVKNEVVENYYLLLELQLNLQTLQFIGKSLENFQYPFPPNCVIFYLSDGIYTNLTDIAPQQSPASLFFKIPKSKEDNLQPTSSYDALMRLSTLDDCIQDALITREKLASQINTILKENQASLNVVSEVSRRRESMAAANRYLSAERRRLKSATNRLAELKASLEARREAMRKGRETQAKAHNYLDEATGKLKECGVLVECTTEELRGQRRRICEDLIDIFPIEPIPNHPLSFTIRGLPLPNSDFESSDVDEDTIAAALGHVAHLVYLLSFYLSTPLLYPVQPQSSTSFIRDPISLMPGPRTFPLYAKGSIYYRFDYAIFLLNKDIEQLMCCHALKALDIRHTLPNLKYLLYVLAAGQGELPARKSGGVKGLSLGKATAMAASSSRRGSEDSVLGGTDARKLLEIEARRSDAAVKGKGKALSVVSSDRNPLHTNGFHP